MQVLGGYEIPTRDNVATSGEKVNLVFVAQEFESANHQDLWKILARESGLLTVVINIGADIPVTIWRRRLHRLREAAQGPIWIRDNLVLLRPFYLLRPEVAGKLVNQVNMRLLRRWLKQIVPTIENVDVRALYYDGKWSTLLPMAVPGVRLFYYLMDEVRRIASSDEVHAGRTHWDRCACQVSEHIFLMTRELLDARSEFGFKATVIGNGSLRQELTAPMVRDTRAVGIIGNIRNWIDCELLESLILIRQDLSFHLVGNVEDDMREFVDRLMRSYSNVSYHGKVQRREVTDWYRRCGAVIVPYRQNSFIQATRPIKIVEAVFAGTPVVSVPMSGYVESSMIRFARDAGEFSRQLDHVLNGGIDLNSEEYIEFLASNSWDRVARDVLRVMDSS